MKLMDVLCPPVADIGRIRATSYWLKEEVKVLGRRIEKVYGQLAHERAVEEVFLQLAGRYPQIVEELRDGALCVDCGAHAGHVSEVLLQLVTRITNDSNQTIKLYIHSKIVEKFKRASFARIASGLDNIACTCRSMLGCTVWLQLTTG